MEARLVLCFIISRVVLIRRKKKKKRKSGHGILKSGIPPTHGKQDSVKETMPLVFVTHAFHILGSDHRE